MVRSSTAATALALFFMASCASHGPPVEGSDGADVIDAAEIEGADADNVLDLIQRIRPSWLLGASLVDPSDPADPGARSAPSVLINEVPPLPLFTLQFMPAGGVREIRYLTATGARSRYGVSAPNGLIVVVRPPLVSPRPDTGRVPGSSALPADTHGDHP